jgi:uncharacterized protein (TIGR02466 family)
MNIVKNEFWATPVWEIDTGLDDYFNSVLENDVAAIANTGDYYDVWDSKAWSVNRLKEVIQECLDLTVKDLFPPYHPYSPHFIDGWGQKTAPGEDLLLHGHPHAVCVATYYVRAPEKSGDLLLVDARGTVNWNMTDDPEAPRLLHGVTYKRIKPKAGKLVIFPGYVPHMVEVNRSTQDRLSIATNIVNRFNYKEKRS